MLFAIDANLVTTEHCELEKQCNDAGCEERVIRKTTQTVQNHPHLIVLELLLLQHRKTVGKTAREGTLELELEHWLRLRLQLQLQQRSMGGNWNKTCKHCLAFILALTFAFTFTVTLTTVASTLVSTPTFTFTFTLFPTFPFQSTFTFTFALTFTFAQLSVCRFGRMNRKVAFTVCITFTCPYRLMSLHRTISTSIRAVDDNQVCSS